MARLTEQGPMHPADARLDEDQLTRLRADDKGRQWFCAQAPSYRRADIRERRRTHLMTDSAAGLRVPPLVQR